MQAVLAVILYILDIYRWVLIAMIIMSWLISFNVINTRNGFVEGLWRVLNQLTEPVLRPIRRIMPNFSGLDISPIIAFILIFFIDPLSPMPHDVGSRNPRQALPATAASTADPPRRRRSMPAWVASGCAVPTAPEQP